MPILPTGEDKKDGSNSALDANVHVKIHASLYLPRCDETIPWLKCHNQKNNDNTKDLETKWKESWKALHNLYNDNHTKISSIGISNFNGNDIKELLEYTQKDSLTVPHFYQGNINIILFDKDLVDLLTTHHVSLIIYHTISDVLTPNNNNDNEKSLTALKEIANEHWKNDYDNAVQLSKTNEKEKRSKDKKPKKSILQNKDKKYTIAQLLLCKTEYVLCFGIHSLNLLIAWLTQRGH